MSTGRKPRTRRARAELRPEHARLRFEAQRRHEHTRDLRPPSMLHMMLEARAPAEVVAGLLSYLLAHRLPRGDGQPVLVFPGLIASDSSTFLLRSLMQRLGYPAYGWNQGFNVGPRHGVLAGCRERIEEIVDKHGRAVTLIGWSLGGIYAREMAKLLEREVRQVVTLGTPFAGNPRATNAYPLFQLLSGHKVHADETLLARLREAPNQPTSSIYSRSDGVVHWQCSVQHPAPHVENIELSASHFGMGFNPAVLYALADRLAQPEGRWRPFRREGLRRFIFPEPAL